MKFKLLFFVYVVFLYIFAFGSPVKEMLAGKNQIFEEDSSAIKEVEYLESTGTQYIDTKYIPNSKTKCLCSVEVLALSAYWYNPVFGCGTAYNGNNIFCIAICQSAYEGFFYRGNNFNKVIYNALSIGDMVRFVTSPTMYGIENITKGQNYYQNYINPRYTEGNETLFLFAGNVPGTRDLNHATRIRVYHLEIFEDDEIIHELIPVREGTNGYMYDIVTGEKFQNIGPGDFIIGPDKE